MDLPLICKWMTLLRNKHQGNSGWKKSEWSHNQGNSINAVTNIYLHGFYNTKFIKSFLQFSCFKYYVWHPFVKIWSTANKYEALQIWFAKWIACNDSRDKETKSKTLWRKGRIFQIAITMCFTLFVVFNPLQHRPIY